MSNPSAFAAVIVASFEPSPERRQHDRITRDSETLADSDGNIGMPWRAETLLERLQDRGDIHAKERHAGEEFHRLFQLAHRDGLRAPDIRREGCRSQPDGPHGGDRARHRIADAIDVLGGHGSACGSCAWFVLGTEMTLRQWAMREGWGGRPIRPDTAKGTLVGTLGVLARHFGL